jgi:hypothetical protein
VPANGASVLGLAVATGFLAISLAILAKGAGLNPLGFTAAGLSLIAAVAVGLASLRWAKHGKAIAGVGRGISGLAYVALLALLAALVLLTH